MNAAPCIEKERPSSERKNHMGCSGSPAAAKVSAGQPWGQSGDSSRRPAGVPLLWIPADRADDWGGAGVAESRAALGLRITDY